MSEMVWMNSVVTVSANTEIDVIEAEKQSYLRFYKNTALLKNFVQYLDQKDIQLKVFAMRTR